MALTLVQAGYLSNDVLQAGIIELFVRDDPILEKLGFIDVLGNGLTYNVETTESTAQFYSVGDTWVESTPVTTPTTATLVIMGGDADVDNYLKATRSNINDLKQEVIAAKVKAVKHKWGDTFYYGHTTLDAKGFNGLHKLVESYTYNTHAIGSTNTTETALSMGMLEEGIDLMKVNKPELIVMSKMMRRYINTYLRGVGGLTYDDAANKRIQTLFGVPVAVSDYVRNTENVLHDYLVAAGGSTTTDFWGYDSDVTTVDTGTSIFILSFGPKACQGIQAGPMTIEEVSSAMETKDASRWRIKWYVSLMLQNILTCTKVTGIDPDGTVVV